MIAYIRRWFRRGRHRWGDSDLAPPGRVWFHDGIWWTFSRSSAQRVPREFDRRSNPLDHPWEIENGQKYLIKQHFREVEY